MQRKIFIIHGSPRLTDHALNGDGLIAWSFIKELARRGHRVHVASDRLDVKAELPPNLTLTEFPRRHSNGAMHYLSYMQRARTFYDQLAAIEGVDIVHQMNPVVRGISLSLLGRDVPIVLGSYDGDWVPIRSAPYYKKATLGTKFNALFKGAIDAAQQHYAASLVLSTPHALKRVPFGFDVAARIEFLHHGVDLDLYSPVPMRSDPPVVEQQIVYVGLIELHKGVQTLAESFIELSHQVRGASLVFVGDGSLVPQLKSRFNAAGIEHRVKFTGLAKPVEVAGWLRSSTVLCAPSFGEPYGQNVIEAMATAKPVVITTEGGHRYIGDALGAASVLPGNVAQLTSALSRILLDVDLATEMGRHNRQVAEHRHDIVHVTNLLEEIYNRAMQR